jgi:hypothetical protein
VENPNSVAKLQKKYNEHVARLPSLEDSVSKQVVELNTKYNEQMEAINSSAVSSIEYLKNTTFEDVVELNKNIKPVTEEPVYKNTFFNGKIKDIEGTKKRDEETKK